MRSSLRTLALNLTLLSAVILATLVAGEGIVRLVRPQPLEAAYMWADGTLRHRPSFRYTYSRQEFSNTVSFNSMGLRGPEVLPGKVPGVPRVLFLGDSFVEGKQVGDEEVLTSALGHLAGERGIRLEIINAGVAGYGTAEELILWERLGRSLEPDIVVLGFYPNDVRNNVERRHFLLKDGEVVRGREPRLPRVRWIYDLRKSLAARSHVYMLLKNGKKALRERATDLPAARLLETEEVFLRPPSQAIAGGWELTEALLTELKDRVEATGAEFLLAIFPTRFQVDQTLWEGHAGKVGLDPSRFDLEVPGRRLREWAGLTGARVVDLLEPFRRRNRGNSFYFSIDAHWNPQGQRLAAETILEELERSIL